MTSAPRTHSPALSTGLVPVPAAFKERELARLVRIGLLVPLALGAALQPGLPWAAPAGGRVVGGSGSIQSGGNLTQIQQGSHRLAIDWQSYHVGAQETVRYLQPSASAAALNRVLDGNPSQILGRIEANGQVFLMNPSGIIFGNSATVNVGSLVAAAMDMDKAKFMNGIYEMGVPAGIEPGMVVNQGLLEAATGGSVTLVGGAVKNEGAIIAKLGQVNLGAGRRAVVDFEGNDIIRFAVDGELTANTHQVESAVSNTGTIDAAGGTVLMTAKTAGDVFTSVVNNAGIVRVGSIDTQGGEIRLTGSGGLVRNSGTLDASGTTGGKVSVKGLRIDHTGRILAEGRGGAGGQAVLEAVDTTTVSKGGVISVRAAAGRGGSADVLGERVALRDQARLDASGSTGGGKIRVGGDYQGKNAAVRNARNTEVGAGVTMAANAGARGDGGTVIVWADGDTRFSGAISATGGSGGGNGGMAEVSGKETLDFAGTADLRASVGTTGTLLLDPRNVIIDATLAGTLKTALGTANVVVSTVTPGDFAGTITVAAPITAPESDNSLTLSSHSDIILDADIDFSAAGTGNLALAANLVDTSFGRIINGTAGGTITMNADRQLQLIADGGIGTSDSLIQTAGMVNFAATTVKGGIFINNTGGGLTVTEVTGPSTGTFIPGITSLPALPANTTIGVTVTGLVFTSVPPDPTPTPLGGDIVLTTDGILTLNKSVTTTGRYTDTANARQSAITLTSETGGIVLGGNVTVATSGNGGGDITLNGTVNGAKALTLHAGQDGIIKANGNIDATTLTVTKSGGATFAGITATKLVLTDTADTKTITINGVLDVGTLTTSTTDGYNLALLGGGTVVDATTIANGGTLTLGDAGTTLTFTNGLTADPTGALTLAGTIQTTNAAIKFNKALTLAGDVVLNSGDGAITLEGKVNAATAGQQGLTLTGKGLTTIKEAMGETALKFLTVNGEGDTELAANITTSGGGEIKFADALILTADAVLNSGDGAITLEGKVNAETAGQQGLTLTGKGLTTIKEAMGETALKFLTVNGEGDTELAANITTSGGGEIKFADALILTADAVLNSGDGAITLEGKVNAATAGEQGLTLTGKGLTTITAALGETALKFLTVNGEGDTELAANITTKGGAIRFDDALRLTGNVTLDTTKDATDGADITLAGVSGSDLDRTLTLNAGTAGIVGTGTIGTNIGTLTLTNSGGATFAGITAGTLVLTDTADTKTITVTGALNLGTLTTTTKSYNLALLGGGTVGGVTSIANGGTLTLGDESTDVLTFTGGLTANPTGTLTLAGTIKTTNADIKFNKALTLAQDVVLNSGDGAITLEGKVDATTVGGQGLTLTGKGLTTITAALGETALKFLTVNGEGDTELAANITTKGGAIRFDDALRLTGNVTLDTTKDATDGADITLAGVSGSDLDRTLTLNAGTAGIVGTGTIGTNIGTLTLTNSGGATFAGITAGTLVLTDTADTKTITVTGALNLGTLTTTTKSYNLALLGGGTVGGVTSIANGGTLTLGDESTDVLTFTGGLTANPTGTLTLAGTIKTTNADIKFNKALTLAQDVVLNSGDGAITLEGKVDATTVGGQGLTLTGKGLTTITAALGETALKFLTVNGEGDTELAANITTKGGAIRFDDALRLTGNVTLDTTKDATDGADITLAGVSGSDLDRTLTLNAGTAGIVGTGTIGTNIGTLTLTNSGGATFAGITAGTLVLTDTADTKTITVTGALNLGTLTTTTKSYNLALLGGGTVDTATTIANGGALTLGDAVGDTLTFTGGLTANPTGALTLAGTIQTTNAAIKFNKALTLAQDVILASGGGAITLAAVNAKVAGGQGLTLNSGDGVTTLGGVIGATALKHLITDAGAGATELGSNVSTTGAITFADTLTLAQDVVLASGGGAITLAAVNAKAVGEQGLTLNSGAGVTTLGGVIGATALKHLTTDAGTGATELGSDVSTTGAITFGDNLKLLGNVLLDTTKGAATGAAINLASVSADAAANNRTLTLNAGTTGVVKATGGIGTQANGALAEFKLTNSGGATFAGITAGTLVLTDTADTITVTGALNLDTLTTTTNGYNLALLGGGTVGGLTTIANGGALTLGAAGTTLTFTNGLTANPTGALTLAGTIQTTDANITFNKALTLTQDVKLNSGAGAITLVGAVDAANPGVQSLTLTGKGLTTLGGALGGGGKALEFLTVNGDGETHLAANVTTQAGAITFEDALVLTDDVQLASGGGAITFMSTVDGSTAGSENLTLTAGAGDIRFDNKVGSKFELGAIDIDSAGNLAAAAMTAVKLEASATGTATLTGNLKLSGEGGVDITANQFILSMDSVETTFNDPNDPTKHADIRFAGDTELTRSMDFTVAGKESDINLLGDWSSMGAPHGSNGWTLTLTYVDGDFVKPTVAESGPTSIRFVQNIGLVLDPYYLIPDAGLVFNGNVRLIHNVIFAQERNLTNPIKGALVFKGLVITSGGAWALTIGDLFHDALDDQRIGDMFGNVEFHAKIGDLTPLGAITIATEKDVIFRSTLDVASLNVVANSTTLGGDITTTDTVTGVGITSRTSTVLTADRTINAGAGPIRFTGAVEGSTPGAQSLTLNSTGTTTINGSVGATTALKSLTTDSGGGTWLGGNVTTRDGAITLNDALTLTADAVLAAGNGAINLLGINAAGAGQQGLTLNSTGITTLGGLIGNQAALKQLITDGDPAAIGGFTRLAADVTTLGGVIAFNDALTLTADVILAGGAITLAQVDAQDAGQQRLTLNSQGVTTLGGIIGGTNALESLTTDGGGSTRLGASVKTQGGAIRFDDALILTGALTLDTSSGVPGGANIDLRSVDADAASANRTLTLRAGSQGRIGVTGSIGAVQALTGLTLVNSGSADFAAIKAGTLDLQDTTSTIIVNGGLDLANLITAAEDYNLALLGGGTVGAATTIKNKGVLTLGDGGDGFTFSGGLTAIAPSAVKLGGTLASLGTAGIELGAVAVTNNSTVGGVGTGALTLGNATLADDVTLTVGSGAANRVTLGTVTGTAGGPVSHLTFNSTGTVNVDAIGSDIGTVTLTNSGGATFAGITAGKLALQDTKGGIQVRGNLTLNELTTADKGYDLLLLGDANSVTKAVTFLNSGILTLGDAPTDTSRFHGGLTATTPGTIQLAGTIQTTGQAITIGDAGSPIVLMANASLDTTVGGGDGAITLGGSVNDKDRSGTSSLTLTAGTDAVVFKADIGTTNPLAAVKIASAGSVTLAGITADTLNVGTLAPHVGSLTVAGNLKVNTLTTTTSPYNLAFLGSKNEITNRVTFNNSGMLTLGDAPTDTSRFHGGLTATTPGTIQLAGTIQTTGQAITIGDAGSPIVLMANASLDTTVGGGDGAIALGGSVNDKDNAATSSLTLTAGTDAVVFGSDIGAIMPLAAVRIASAGSVTFAGITADTLDVGTLAATVDSLTVAGNLKVNTLTTSGRIANLALLGSANEVTEQVTFNNSGILTLGDAQTDTSSFHGGLTATSQSTIRLAGNLLTSNDAIVLGGVGTTVSFTKNTLLSSGGGAITLRGNLSGGSLTVQADSGTVQIETTGTLDPVGSIAARELRVIGAAGVGAVGRRLATRVGNLALTDVRGSAFLQNSGNLTFLNSNLAGDLDLVNAGTVALQQVQTPGQVTLTAAGGLTDANGSATNLVADRLVINGGAAVATSQDALETQVRQLQLTTGAAAITNTGSLQVADSQVSGRLALRSSGDLVLNAIAAGGQSVALHAGGDILDGNGIGTNLTAADLSLSAGGGIGVADLLDTAVSTLGFTAGGAARIANQGALQVSGRAGAVELSATDLLHVIGEGISGASGVDLRADQLLTVDAPLSTNSGVLQLIGAMGVNQNADLAVTGGGGEIYVYTTLVDFNINQSFVGGAITMAPDTSTRNLGGSIEYAAANTVTLGTLEGKTVTVTAVNGDVIAADQTSAIYADVATIQALGGSIGAGPTEPLRFGGNAQEINLAFDGQAYVDSIDGRPLDAIAQRADYAEYSLTPGGGVEDSLIRRLMSGGNLVVLSSAARDASGQSQRTGEDEPEDVNESLLRGEQEINTVEGVGVQLPADQLEEAEGETAVVAPSRPAGGDGAWREADQAAAARGRVAPAALDALRLPPRGIEIAWRGPLVPVTRGSYLSSPPLPR